MAVVCYRVAADELETMAVTAATLDDLSRHLPQGVYTTLRTYPGGRALHVDDHLRRLEESAAILGHPLRLSRGALRMAMGRALQRSGFALARLRLTVAVDAPDATFVSLAPFVPVPEERYRDGVRTVTSHLLSRATPEAKTTGFVDAGARARAAAPPATEEVLLVDAEGSILEGTTSNFFAVVDGRLRTAGEGVLHGITRTMVLEAAEGLLPVEYRPVRVEELGAASEAFLTSSSRGVMAVVAVDHQAIGAGRPGPTAAELRRRYEARVEQDLEPLGQA